MIKTIFLFLTIFLQFQAAPQAQPNNQKQDFVEYIGAIIEQTRPPKGLEISNDSIEGNCYFEGSGCNGAEVSIFTSDDKLIEKQTLNSLNIPSFVFRKLKKEHSYKVKINYSRYNASGELVGAKTGSLLLIEIKRDKPPDQ